MDSNHWHSSESPGIARHRIASRDLVVALKNIEHRARHGRFNIARRLAAFWDFFAGRPPQARFLSDEEFRAHRRNFHEGKLRT